MFLLVIKPQTKFSPLKNVNVSPLFIISGQKIVETMTLNCVILRLTSPTPHASVQNLDAQRTTTQEVWLVFTALELHNCED